MLTARQGTGDGLLSKLAKARAATVIFCSRCRPHVDSGASQFATDLVVTYGPSIAPLLIVTAFISSLGPL